MEMLYSETINSFQPPTPDLRKMLYNFVRLGKAIATN